jgi:hypothetical protein
MTHIRPRCRRACKARLPAEIFTLAPSLPLFRQVADFTRAREGSAAGSVPWSASLGGVEALPRHAGTIPPSRESGDIATASATDEKSKRRSPRVPRSTGRRVTPREREYIWFEKLHRHGGALPTAYLHAFTKHLAASEKATTWRVRDLFHEANTPHRGTYLARNPQLQRGFVAVNPGVMSELTPRAEAALRQRGLWRPNTPPPSPVNVRHDTLLACATASIELAVLQEDPGRYGYIFHDEIVDRAGRLKFEARGSPLIPDRAFGINYGDSGALIVLVEADMGTENLRAGGRRKTIEHNLRQYDDFLGGGYKEHFGEEMKPVVVYLTTLPQRLEHMLALAQEVVSRRTCTYLLFQALPEFADFLAPPPILTRLFLGPYRRAGRSDFYINSLG